NKLSQLQSPKIKKVAFCAYTGKASRVLESRLKEAKAIFPDDRVSTIHSLIYTALLNPKGEVVGWDKKDVINFDLIIVDEASMVDSKIWQDLLTFGLPVLAIGDHGQLYPINGKFNLKLQPHVK